MKWKRFFASTAIVVMAFTVSGSVLSVPSAFADTTTQTQTQQNQGTGIPGMPNPSFTGETPNAGFSNPTTDVGTFIGKKFKLGLTILFGIATIVIVCLGIWKGMRLSGSNSRTRADIVHDLAAWIIGAAITFGSAVICGLLYAFSTSA